MNDDTRERTLADFARIADTLPGARLPWLARARSAALERFAFIGYPGLRDEDWKYTSLATLEKQPFLALTAEPQQRLAESVVTSLALNQPFGHLLVFHNGRHVPALSAADRLPAGVTLTSLATALENNPEPLEAYLSDDAGHHRNQTVFGALNTAFMADGAYLHLGRGISLDEPVHLLFISTEAGAAITPRNLIVAETGSSASVIEHYAGPDEVRYFTNALTQIFAADDAAIAHYKLQQEAPHAFHIAGIHAHQGRGSRLESHSIALGAGLCRNDITTAFDAPGCEATLNGLYLAGGRQHVDHHTRIDHIAPNGSSREYYRGVLDGVARAVFNGKVVVHPGAQKTNAHQANHNLLLSRDAEIDTKPELEIYADDVQCTHGATVGQIDEAQIFYLRSRGIEEAMAKSLLVHAFAHDVIERIRVQALRNRLEQILFTRLPQGERIRELT
jgi:Fe-S cluster assembly protein SufD